jgi:anti-anti-sigma factor
MTIKKRKGCNKKSGRCLLAAAGNLTIETIAQNHAELAKLFGDYRHFEIDLAKVEEIDFTGIQLLLALQQSMRKDNKQLTLNSASPAVAEAMGLLQLGQQFDWAAEVEA